MTFLRTTTVVAPALMQARIFSTMMPSTGPRIRDKMGPINGGLNSQSGQMEISFSFQTGDGPTGSDTWAKLTQEYLEKQIAITLDSAVISAPVIHGVTPY